MATALTVSKELLEFQKSVAGLAKVALAKTALDLTAAFTLNSPVDTGIFRAEWDFLEGPVSPGVLAQVTVTNRMPYAGVLDEGSPVGGIPWASEGPKTIEKDGRIWSKQAVGGVTSPVLDDSDFSEGLIKSINTFIFGKL